MERKKTEYLRIHQGDGDKWSFLLSLIYIEYYYFCHRVQRKPIHIKLYLHKSSHHYPADEKSVIYKLYTAT